MRFIADTHSLLWYLQDHPRLSTTSRLLFDEQGQRGKIIIPTIVLAELLYISRKIRLSSSFEKTVRLLETEERFEIHPLSLEILKEAMKLDGFEMHDCLIIATALHLNIPLMTRDDDIVASNLVKILPP